MAGASTTTKQAMRRARFAFGRFQNRITLPPFVLAARACSGGTQVPESKCGLLDVDRSPRAPLPFCHLGPLSQAPRDGPPNHTLTALRGAALIRLCHPSPVERNFSIAGMRSA